MRHNSTWTKWTILCAGFLATSLVFSTALRPSPQGKANPSTPPPAAVGASTVSHAAPVPSIATSITSAREASMFRKLWGVDDIHIRSTAAGSLIRFSYRVVDAEKAKILMDKRSTLFLVDEKTGMALQIPVMEKIGQLRQTATPQNGREYWMAFSNKGRFVQPG